VYRRSAMAEAITEWRELSGAEKAILAAVKTRPYGAQRFLVDPARFLRESGFALGEVFAAQLNGLPGVRANPVGAYDEVLAGRHPLCRQPITITSLGLPDGMDERT
jgi:hypothetical protein